MFAFFLSSGLFLGWSLGANDASNVFGTAAKAGGKMAVKGATTVAGVGAKIGWGGLKLGFKAMTNRFLSPLTFGAMDFASSMGKYGKLAGSRGSINTLGRIRRFR